MKEEQFFVRGEKKKGGIVPARVAKCPYSNCVMQRVWIWLGKVHLECC